jgi:hypothetical protein
LSARFDLILCYSPAPMLTYFPVRSALSPARASSQADLATNSQRFALRTEARDTAPPASACFPALAFR